MRLKVQIYIKKTTSDVINKNIFQKIDFSKKHVSL